MKNRYIENFEKAQMESKNMRQSLEQGIR